METFARADRSTPCVCLVGRIAMPTVCGVVKFGSASRRRAELATGQAMQCSEKLSRVKQ